jgi:hypothetical protein
MGFGTANVRQTFDFPKKNPRNCFELPKCLSFYDGRYFDYLCDRKISPIKIWKKKSKT